MGATRYRDKRLISATKVYTRGPTTRHVDVGPGDTTRGAWSAEQRAPHHSTEAHSTDTGDRRGAPSDRCRRKRSTALIRHPLSRKIAASMTNAAHSSAHNIARSLQDEGGPVRACRRVNAGSYARGAILASAIIGHRPSGAITAWHAAGGHTMRRTFLWPLQVTFCESNARATHRAHAATRELTASYTRTRNTFVSGRQISIVEPSMKATTLPRGQPPRRCAAITPARCASSSRSHRA
jgi:hypothetical protein